VREGRYSFTLGPLYPERKGTVRSERLSGRTGILSYWDSNIGRSVLITEYGPTRIEFLLQKPEGKRPLGIPKHKWDYNVKKNPNKKGMGAGGRGLDSTGLA